MEYYFTPKENISSGTLYIKDDEAKHLLKVLRKKEGEKIYVTDGEYNLYKTAIINSGKDFIECKIVEQIPEINEPKIKISLYQSLLKNPSRFEFVIEKAVELGVFEIIPLVTENVINKNTSRIERWQSIALSAMKQSQRCYLPKVLEPVSISEALKTISKVNVNLIAHEQMVPEIIRTSDLAGKIDRQSSVSIFIGPEGGFTEEEIKYAQSCDFKVLSLGSRKLRSETAAILASGIILHSL